MGEKKGGGMKTQRILTLLRDSAVKEKTGKIKFNFPTIIWTEQSTKKKRIPKNSLVVKLSRRTSAYHRGKQKNPVPTFGMFNTKNGSGVSGPKIKKKYETRRLGRFEIINKLKIPIEIWGFSKIDRFVRMRTNGGRGRGLRGAE